MNCCDNYLGAFPHNENIHTGIPALQNGTYTLELEFAGSKQFKYLNIVAPGEIIVYMPFNENYTYKMRIKQPDGEYLEVDGCSDHTFKTYILIDGDCGDDCEFDYD